MSTALVVGGIKLNIFGLEQYNTKQENCPVSVVFSLHGRLQNSETMNEINEALSALNSKPSRDAASRTHLLVVSFDHANHGSRLVDNSKNLAWKDTEYDNETHAMDMWSFQKAAADTVSLLIDLLEFYIFPEQDSKIVQYGVLGFSLGGHASYLASSKDSRLSLCIALVGCADYEALLKHRASSLNLPSQAPYLPERFLTNIVRKSDTIHHPDNLFTTKLLMINGAQDNVVPAKCNTKFVEKVRTSHKGVEGKDWQWIVLPDLGHEWSPEMIQSCKQWCFEWMYYKTI
ncbi:Alpha/Beta hydrolase protein [Umbelopsis sp. PMI_123]|nr:Alpha/Beta hydrolase protein [Umbelopsis sp. PMI_123]